MHRTKKNERTCTKCILIKTILKKVSRKNDNTNPHCPASDQQCIGFWVFLNLLGRNVHFIENFARFVHCNNMYNLFIFMMRYKTKWVFFRTCILVYKSNKSDWCTWNGIVMVLTISIRLDSGALLLALK